jgi:hypothetical protein
MAKITSKASLTLGTNLFLHIADKGGTDITISNTNSQITSSSTDFTASTTSGGITNRAIVVGDVLEVSHTTNAANEGVVLEVTAINANQIDFTVVSGSPVNESAGSEINLVARKKTYEFVEAGGLSFVDGVQGAVLHSVLIDLWSANDLDKYAPPFTSIEPRAKSMANINYWEPHNSDTLNAIRDTALEIRDTATSAARRVYALLRTNGQLDEVTDQMYFWSTSDSVLTAPNQAVMTGYINQLILIRDTDNSIDKRGNWVVRCAEPGKTILYSVSDIQYAEIITVPNNNSIDPKLADPGTGTPYTSDGTISSGGDYSDILYYLDVDSVYTGDVNGVDYDFAGYIDADNQTNEKVHEKINYLWRQPIDVNSDGTGPAKRGDKQPPVTTFSGDVFNVEAYLLNYNNAQRNDIRVVDTGGTTRQWPIVNTITITSPALAVGGTFTIYHANSHGTGLAAVLQNEGGVDQQDITIESSVSIPFSYSTYDVDGHTPNTPFDIVIAFSRPGFIEAGLTEPVTLDGNDKTISLAVTADPSYIA